jgi:flagellar protein FliS
MWNNGHDAYLESRVLSANPLELVHMLYQGCAQSVREARHYLAQGEIGERSRTINKACEILMELNGALDHERGGEIAQRLAQLYVYMQARLLEANMQQTDGPLAEVQQLLATLGEAWEGVKPAPAAAPAAAPAESTWSMPVPQESYAAQAWSL